MTPRKIKTLQNEYISEQEAKNGTKDKPKVTTQNGKKVVDGYIDQVIF